MEYVFHIGCQKIGSLGLIAYQMDNVRYQADDIQAYFLGLSVNQQGEELIENRG